MSTIKNNPTHPYLKYFSGSIEAAVSPMGSRHHIQNAVTQLGCKGFLSLFAAGIIVGETPSIEKRQYLPVLFHAGSTAEQEDDEFFIGILTKEPSPFGTRRFTASTILEIEPGWDEVSVKFFFDGLIVKLSRGGQAFCLYGDNEETKFLTIRYSESDDPETQFTISEPDGAEKVHPDLRSIPCIKIDKALLT